jgi:hypothetical protein
VLLYYVCGKRKWEFIKGRAHGFSLYIYEQHTVVSIANVTVPNRMEEEEEEGK